MSSSSDFVEKKWPRFQKIFQIMAISPIFSNFKPLSFNDLYLQDFETKGYYKFIVWATSYQILVNFRLAV